MNLEELQSYNFISMQMLCCTEIRDVMKSVPKVLPTHYIEKIDNPLRRVNFQQKVRVGELEVKIHEIVQNINKHIKQYDKYFINFIPLFNILWMSQYVTISPYLIKEATELFKKTDLIILQSREEITGRSGELSWYARPNSKTKSLENDISCDLVELLFANDIKYITINRLLKIAQENNIRG